MKDIYPEYDPKTDSWYRWEQIGNNTIKSYAPDMITAHGTPVKQEPKKQVERVAYCPIRAHRPKCNPHCALYAGGCRLAVEPANNNTDGKSCPFDSYRCGGACALYNNGCTLIRIFEKGLEK